jgi:hypothetical protein
MELYTTSFDSREGQWQPAMLDSFDAAFDCAMADRDYERLQELHGVVELMLQEYDRGRAS